MTRSLLTTSRVQLFGQRITDIKLAPVKKDDQLAVTFVTTTSREHFTTTTKAKPLIVNLVNLEKDNLVLLRGQDDPSENGLWKVGEETGTNPKLKLTKMPIGQKVTFKSEKGRGRNFYWRTKNSGISYKKINKHKFNLKKTLLGANNQLHNQIDANGAGFAKIFGFSFEGEYFDLQKPAIYLVHGDGEVFTQDNRRSRAPRSPNDSGLGATSFQFASDMRVWEYDKADFTVRLDLSAGMFEDVLLDFEIDYEDHPMFAGGKVGGGKVGGGKVGGGKVGGGKVGGGKVGGGKVGGGKVGFG